MSRPGYSDPPEREKEMAKVLVVDFEKCTGCRLCELVCSVKQEGVSNHRARLMVIGACLDDSALTGIIEELGALVVSDAECFGSWYFWEPVELGENPLEDLARSYLNSPPCPRMVGEHTTRLNYISEMVKTYRVDGIILQRVRNCDLWGGETLVIQKGLQESGIPLLILDREYILSGMGQLKTRIQAFLEMLEGK